jgi:putative serine protease PepD
MSDGVDEPRPSEAEASWADGGQVSYAEPPPPAPPASETSSPASTLRRHGALVLVAGLVIGAAAAYGVTRVTGPGGTVTINVDNTPVHASTNNAEGVATMLVPAVGTIIARTGGTSASLGSGFVIAQASGVSYLVTNNHVVTGSSDLHVAMPNGDNYSATLVGTDTLDDIAVVSVPNASLPMATFGDSSQLKVGQTVIAIGSPLGNASSVTAGVISALHRTITASGEGATSSETLEDVLQTDASINPGNSGGPLADVQGRVVGVNVAIAGSSTNIGYSIPANLARQVAGELIAHQKVQHPFLGIGYLDSIDAIEAGRGFNGPGVLVTQVTAGTPAAGAGFQVNDILVAIDGVAIDNGQTLGGLIQDKRDGDKIMCTVKRGSSTLTLTPTLEERPSGL